jgi:hypothetical protein
MSGPPGSTFSQPVILLKTPVGVTVGIFLGISALIAIFGVNASMILIGWLQEKYEEPAFVFGIVISLFLLFNTFAVVQFLQYKRVGKWSDYLRGEKTYITLSLVAKSALAWQIFASTLVK